MIDRSQRRNSNTGTMEKDYLFASSLLMLRRLSDTAQGQLPKDGAPYSGLSPLTLIKIISSRHSHGPI